ncbi:hypothetical protein SAMN06893096_11388 [Geodermatophilus pulveris]|uniref:Uncharacterized protein n=1 Tax=Geodermatophilus pulveris TaxID=1564159 RepID=A0A239JBM1_9ACTN|nr:hypothetical protein SAMN06893096_11388 [Geodermatophilus pulveris]
MVIGQGGANRSPAFRDFLLDRELHLAFDLLGNCYFIGSVFKGLHPRLFDCLVCLDQKNWESVVRIDGQA